MSRLYCYYHMRARANPPDIAPPDNLDWDMWTGPAPMRPYNEIVHPRGWRSFKEYGNGILGDMCIHMLDTVRWMLDLGWPKRISSAGGILVDKDSKANIPDTQTATFDFGDLTVVWEHRTWGSTPDPKYPWGLTIYGDKGTLKASVMSYDFTPERRRRADPPRRHLRTRPVPRGQDREGPRETRRPGHSRPHEGPARLHRLAAASRWPISSKATSPRPPASWPTWRSNSAAASTWDAANGRVVNDDEANARLARPYRSPWVHPEVGSV